MDEVKGVEYRNRSLKKYILLGTFSILIIVIVILLLLIISSRTPNNTLPYPVSKKVAQSLKFDIYYPNQKLLPYGYTLNKSSFTSSNQALIYTVSYGIQNIVFSDQAKPTYDQLLSFVNANIPLNTTQNTSIGTATIGAINKQTVISLPTNSNAWLIITTSGSINQNLLGQVLNSIEIAR